MKDPNNRRATITKAARGEGKFIRRSGSRGQYGHVILKIEPNGRGKGIEIVSDIVGRTIPEEYIAPLTEGVLEVLHDCVITGCPVVDIVVRVVDGSYHETDSSALAFKLAGIFAIKDAIKQADPIEIK